MSARLSWTARSELMLAWILAAAATGAQPNTYYVDSGHGDDGQDGRRPETAWRSLAKVNRAALAPGDRVLFRRGQTWRGQLIPHSGDTSGVITYGAFGEGDKPILLGSVAADRAEDWQQVGHDLWTSALVMDRNCWYQPHGSVFLWGQQTVGADECMTFLRSRGFDQGSVFSDPKFVDPVQHNYRLSPDSPARALAGQSKPAGALPD